MEEKGRVERMRTVRILGTHGVPAAYGGFETAAENVGLFLRDQGWRVIVYCQVPGGGEPIEPMSGTASSGSRSRRRAGWLGTSSFDGKSIRHALRTQPGSLADLRLQHGVFDMLQRLRGIPNVINMDGIEWSRARWGLAKQAILYANERIACWVGDVLIADHPEIETLPPAHGRRRGDAPSPTAPTR